jgi:hypothetical protein
MCQKARELQDGSPQSLIALQPLDSKQALGSKPADIGEGNELRTLLQVFDIS